MQRLIWWLNSKKIILNRRVRSVSPLLLCSWTKWNRCIDAESIFYTYTLIYCITGKFREFGPYANSQQENFVNFGIEEVLSFPTVVQKLAGSWEQGANIRMQENFANLATFAKISCTRIFAVIQYKKCWKRWIYFMYDFTHEKVFYFIYECVCEIFCEWSHFVRNHLWSTISGVITYEIPYEITDKMMSKMALPDFRT